MRITKRLLLPLLMTSGCFVPRELPETETDTESDGGSSSGTTSASAQSSSDAGTSDTSADTGLDPTTGSSGSLGSSSTGTPEPKCGDGVVTPPEACDDGSNDGEYGGCLPGCVAPAPRCGDSTLNGPETCDDGNETNGDGCNIDCTASAEVLWTQVRGGATPCVDEQATDVAVAADGLIFVSGVECTEGGRRGRLLAFERGGAEAWSQDLDGATLRTAEAVAATDAGAVVAGRSDSSGFVAAYDSDGGLDWEATRAPQGAGVVAVQGVSAFPGGFVVAAGGEALGGSFVAYTERLNLDDGSSVAEYHSDATPSAFMGIAVDLATSDSIAVGFHNGGSSQDDNILAQRIGSNGTLAWDDTHDGSESERDQAHAVAVSGDGSFVVVGEAREGSRDIWIRMYSAEGSSLWTSVVDSPDAGIDEANGVAIDSQGAVVVVGQIDRSDLAQGSDVWIRKYTSEGEELWTRTHNGPADSTDTGNAVAVDAEDRIVVVGKEAVNTAQDGQLWIRAYTP